MYFLGLDTSTDVCSVAIFDEKEVLTSRSSFRDFSHSSVITSFITQCIQDLGIHISDISAVALAAGPGSYTGLRVGASTAKGLCYGLNIPLVSIDSLTSLSYYFEEDLDSEDCIFPMIDARRDDVYGLILDNKKNILNKIEKLTIDEAFLSAIPYKKVYLCGDGYEKFQNIMDPNKFIFGPKNCDASTLRIPTVKQYNLNNFETLVDYIPFYLNNPNITKSSKKYF
jgi:tRNA threonylcarbamoyladenosine biosynthesis protein TsaB